MNGRIEQLSELELEAVNGGWSFISDIASFGIWDKLFPPMPQPNPPVDGEFE